MKNPEPQVTDGQKKLADILMASIAGLLAAGLGAVAYALYPFIFGMQSDWLAIGVGVLVGMAVSLFGNGRKGVLGIIGAFLSLGSCMTGDVLSAAAVYSFQNKVPFFQILGSLNFFSIIALFQQTADFERIMLYAIAIIIAFALSRATPLYLVSQKKDENE